MCADATQTHREREKGNAAERDETRQIKHTVQLQLTAPPRNRMPTLVCIEYHVWANDTHALLKRGDCAAPRFTWFAMGFAICRTARYKSFPAGIAAIFAVALTCIGKDNALETKQRGVESESE